MAVSITCLGADDALIDIEKVIVLGHSLSAIDATYPTHFEHQSHQPPYPGTPCKYRHPQGACVHFSLTAFPTGLSVRTDQSNVSDHSAWRRSADLHWAHE